MSSDLSSGGVGAVSSLQTMSGNGDTILTAGRSVARCSAGGGARTSVILQSGTYNGQEITVLNEDDNALDTITFDVVAASHVANGNATVINGLQGRKFVWSASAATPAWYELK